MRTSLCGLRRIGLVLGAQIVALACHAAPPAPGSDTRAYNVAHGRVVFTGRCLECHESGRKGAPVFGQAGDWQSRLDQPLETLIRHAVDGHGDMPARGDLDITDQEVAAAVAYVVERTRLIMDSDDVNGLPPTAAGPQTAQTTDPSDQAVIHMFMLLLGGDRWK